MAVIKKKRKTIGYLANSAGGALRPYENDVSGAVAQTADENGFDLVVIAGGVIDFTANFDSQRNFIYDLATATSLDGILLLSFFLNERPYPEGFQEFCDRFADLPIVSIGTVIPGVPSVVINNYQSMSLAMRHVIDEHRCRNIVYLNGPHDNEEARERIKAYKDIVKATGIGYRPEYVIQGDFLKESGIVAAKTILERGLSFDAIVSANDDMAIGAMEYLANAGMQCPKDYIITGFDNLEVSRLVVPALTTIEQSAWELGQTGCQLICDLLEGRPAPQNLEVTTRLQIRESCGCQHPGSFEQETIQDDCGSEGVWPEPEKLINTLLAHIPTVGKKSSAFLRKKTAQLVHMLLSAQTLPEERVILEWMRELFIETEREGVDLGLWTNLLRNLSRHISQAASDFTTAQRMSHMGAKANFLFCESVNNSLRRSMQNNERKESVLRDLNEELITASSFEKLRECLARQLPRLPIKSCYISLFDEAGIGREFLNMRISYSRDEGTRLHTPPVRYPATQVYPAPESYLDMPQDPPETATMHCVEALNYRDEVYGIIIFEMDRIHGSVIEALREQISNTLKNIDTITRIKSDRRQIERLNATLEQKYRRLSALRTIDIAITESKKRDDLLTILLEQIIGQLDVDAAGILLFNKATGTLDYAAGIGFRGEVLRFTHLKPGKGLAGKAAASLLQVFVPDLSASHAELMDIPLFREEHFRAYCAAPLTAHGELVGVLEIFHRSTLEVDDEWHEFLDALAGQAAIALENTTLLESLQEANTGLAEAYTATIEGWSRALELRDHETEGHSLRVARLSVELSRTLGLDGDELEHIYRGALLHDIGKVGIPDNILLKPAALTDEEKEIMYRHPQYAYDLLFPIRFLHPALDIPYYHHEKWDGTGYPKGLKGADIPQNARIFAIIDVWDALSSDRPYRKAWSRERIIEYLIELSGIQFDPEIMPAFLAMIKKGAETV